MSKYLERKAKLVAKYNTNIPEITQEQFDWIRDHYNRTANGNGIDWSVIAHVIDEHTLMLRYVVAHKYLRKDLSIEERARMVLSDDGKVLMFEKWHTDDVWRNTKCCYFRECSHYRYWNRQNWCCRDTQKRVPGFMDEINKLSNIKYLNTAVFFAENPWICIEDTMKRLLDRGSFYEKLQKIGMHNIAFYDYKAYSGELIPINKNESGLREMLGISKMDMKRLFQNPNIECIKILQRIKNITDREFEFAKKDNQYGTSVVQLRKTGINTDKIITYLEKNGVAWHDWIGYVDTLKKMNYPLDDYYLFPKDFYRDDARVANELTRKTNRSKDEMIKKLADAMRNDKAFKEFFAGSDGLVVKVPESAEDLYIEGKKLHNCLASYIDRVASGKSLIFFVRKIEEPDKPYIAMEYANGRIVQCRYDHNVDVTDEKVINFVELLANKLRERRAA